MFEMMLGLSPGWALTITAIVLMTYVVLGGAHADILTDGVQGFLMVIVGALLVILFLTGFGIEGGLQGLVSNLEQQDENLVKVLNPNVALYHSWWAIFAIMLAHVPLGMLPHIGNKLWALKKPSQRKTFIRLAFLFGLTLGMLGLGGLLARAILGDVLLQPGNTTNSAIAALFIEIFPSWLAALLGVGILAAVMSTADGLVVSSSQIIANDLYRLSYVPRFQPNADSDTIDKRVLVISRIATVATMIICTLMAWLLIERNVALIVWIGVGGMMAAFAGPLILGAVWSGVTQTGAFAGLLAGVIVFSITHSGLIDPSWFSAGPLRDIALWLEKEAPNPWSCASMGEIASIGLTWVVSKYTAPLPRDHLDMLFPETKSKTESL